MKTVCILALALMVALTARADVVIEQATESGMMNGKMTMKIKGDRARMDSAGATVLLDLKAGQMMILMHREKLIIRKDTNALRQQTEAAQKAAGFDASKMEKPKATGVTEKVGEWTAEIYEFGVSDLKGKLWVVKDFPDGQIVKEALKRVTAVSTGGFDPSKLEVPGLIVKTQLTTPMGAMTSTIVKAVQEPVNDSEFVLPTDYSEMITPNLPGAGPK